MRKEDAYAPLVEVRPDVHNKHHDEQDTPSRECTQATAEPSLVKQEPNADRPHYLREPVHEVIQRPGTDIEDGAVVVIELYHLSPHQN